MRTRKRFVAVVEYLDDDSSPMELRALAKWMDTALGRTAGVTDVGCKAYFSSEEASVAAPFRSEPTISGYRLVDSRDPDRKRLCVRLQDGLERLVDLYLDEKATTHLPNLIGKTLSHVQWQVSRGLLPFSAPRILFADTVG